MEDVMEPVIEPTVMEPVSNAIVVVQAQRATVGDVYACFVGMHKAFHSDAMRDVFEEDIETLTSVQELLEARFDF